LDDNYQVYINRVARMMLPEAYRSQVQHIQPSPKFRREQTTGEYQATPFPGYSVITPPWQEERDNLSLYESLLKLQQQLVQHLPASLFIPVPAKSFHMTLADLIWDGAFRHANENPDFQAQLRNCIAKSFEHCQQGPRPVVWQLVGLIIMPRALGVGLLPKNEESYERILQLRRAIYQNPSLIALGIDQQYHLTAHITLGYFGDEASETDRNSLEEVIERLNQEWLSTPDSRLFSIHQAELRKFDDMTCYLREPDWPVLTL
jgi:hypothetical protein